MENQKFLIHEPNAPPISGRGRGQGRSPIPNHLILKDFSPKFSLPVIENPGRSGITTRGL